MKRITVNDTVEYLLKYIQDTPGCIRNHISLVNTNEVDEFNNILWPAVFDYGSWEYIKVDRARTKKEVDYDESKLKDVRYFENDVWYPRLLKAKVYSQNNCDGDEEFCGVDIEVSW